MEYLRIPMSGDAVVVAFDMCSSSDVIEELTLTNDLGLLKRFLTSFKRHLARAQKDIPFDPCKFTGDGWILLFPSNTDGRKLLAFLKELDSDPFLLMRPG